MRAAVLRNRTMVVDDLPSPQPAHGQVLVAVKACGICGSDLQFASNGAEVVSTAQRIEGDVPFARLAVDLDRDVYLGHEFAAEIIEAGPGADAPAPGTLVTSMPALLSADGIHPLVYSNDHVCGYAQQMVLSTELALPVPNGLSASHAALNEPIAVGVHTVNRAALDPGDHAIVLGCGPIGIAVIAVLSARGVPSIVASDPSPIRRAAAAAMGAHQVVDPTRTSPFEPALYGAAPTVIFEAAGVPGLLDEAMRRVRKHTKIVVAGVCMQADKLHLIYGASKEVSLIFANGYDPAEFAQALALLADGLIDVGPMITAEVPLEGLPEAFAALADPDRHCKILVVP